MFQILANRLTPWAGVGVACLLLCACGQKGNLYLPGDDDFKSRATLPEILRRQIPGATELPENSTPTPAQPNSAEKPPRP